VTTHADATFTVDSWDEQPYDEQDGVKLARVRLTKTFRGDLVGSSSVEMLGAHAGGEPRAYVAMERIVGTLHGRAGSFVLQHTAEASGGEQSSTLTVVPDSGTGELRGLRGQANITRDAAGGHTFTLDYDISSSQ
jgi:hypothetical protein